LILSGFPGDGTVGQATSRFFAGRRPKKFKIFWRIPENLTLSAKKKPAWHVWLFGAI
jgi:hypothetical protein